MIRLLSVILFFIFTLSFSFESRSKEVEVNVKNSAELRIEFERESGKSAIQRVHRHEEYQIRLLKYRLQRLEHRHNTFEFQMFQGWVIFIMVLVLVLGGLVLAWRQFNLDKDLMLLNARNDGVSAKEGKSKTLSNTTDSHKTTFHLSKDGITISSSVIGLIVLAMSFAFF